MKVIAIIEHIPLVNTQGGYKPSQPTRGNFEFKEVNFAYPSKPKETVLKKMSFQIP